MKHYHDQPDPGVHVSTLTLDITVREQFYVRPTVSDREYTRMDNLDAAMIGPHERHHDAVKAGIAILALNPAALSFSIETRYVRVPAVHATEGAMTLDAQAFR